MTRADELAALISRIDAMLITNAAAPDVLTAALADPRKASLDWLAWAIEQQAADLRQLRGELVALRNTLQSPRELLEFAVQVVLSDADAKEPGVTK